MINYDEAITAYKEQIEQLTKQLESFELGTVSYSRTIKMIEDFRKMIERTEKEKENGHT